MDDEPFALHEYETLAEAFAARVDTKPHNAYYERPATLSLLPEVKDRRVLDAGCGPGVYSEWLLRQGAEVVAIDFSPSMIEYANQRLKGEVRVICADLNKPLSFLKDESFDLVICPLVLDYVANLGGLFAEFVRILVPGGDFTFSIAHPFCDYVAQRQTSYFDTERICGTWAGFGQKIDMPSLRRPFSAFLNPLLESGFQLRRILEPKPILEFKDLDPEDYEKLQRRPGFLCVHASKGEQAASPPC